MRVAALLLLASVATCDDLVVRTVATELLESGRLQVDVDVSWTHSWREDTGRDGVWLFTKYDGATGWTTAEVSSVEVLDGDLEAGASRDQRGVFVSRASEGRGDSAGRLRLLVPGREARVFGLEMVRVEPEQGPACWLAKRVLDQGLYAAFLDHVPDQVTFARAALGGRSYGGPTGTITLEAQHYVAARPAAPCGFLSWDDACALADWAGLRPPRGSELRAIEVESDLWQPALELEQLTLTHGDGRLTLDGRATHRDWPAGDAVLLGGAGGRPRPPLSSRRANVGFRPARTALGSLSILFVGDQATLAGDQPELLAALSRSAGVPRPAKVTVRAQASDRFERMASSKSLLAEISSGRYDVVVLQEALVVLGGARRTPAHARPLVEAAQRGGATPILVMTWGLRDRPSIAFETAAVNVSAWAAQLDALVAPVGLAWRRAQTRNSAVALHDADGRNPSADGAWLNACVLHQLLYGELPSEHAGAPLGDHPLHGDLARVAAQVVRDYIQPR